MVTLLYTQKACTTVTRVYMLKLRNEKVGTDEREEEEGARKREEG